MWISLLVSSRPRIGPRTMHQISLPKCVLTPDGSNKVAEVKVSVATLPVADGLWWTVTSFVLFSLFFASSLALLGGFQGMPNTLRQPGPRANMRQMTPNSSSQGPRGVFSNISFKSFNLTVEGSKCTFCSIQAQLRLWLLAPQWGSQAPAMCHLTNIPPACVTPTLRWCSLSPSSKYEQQTSPVHHFLSKSVSRDCDHVPMLLSFSGSASCARSGTGASHTLHAGCCPPSGAETDAR